MAMSPLKELLPELAWTGKETQPLTQLANMVYVFSEVEMQARYVAYKTKNGRDMDPKAYYAAFLTNLSLRPPA